MSIRRSLGGTIYRRDCRTRPDCVLGSSVVDCCSVGRSHVMLHSIGSLMLRFPGCASVAVRGVGLHTTPALGSGAGSCATPHMAVCCCSCFHVTQQCFSIVGLSLCSEGRVWHCWVALLVCDIVTLCSVVVGTGPRQSGTGYI